ncbi:MAG: rRNA pseudouridine synthase [Bacteroidaceae bacterium]|nr:rRNA pseudouridine synthase [Bacteroidaceae bacterium]
MEEWQNKPADSSSENKSENYGSREGYKTNYNRENKYGMSRQNYQSDRQPYGNRNGADRPRRPRFNVAERAAYSSNGVSNERGFRPQGFSMGEDDNRRQGNYTPRQGYNNRESRGYGYDGQERNNYNRSNYNNHNNYRSGNQGGGYNNNNGYNRGPQQGGGYNRGGYNNNGGGYGNGGYNQQRGGYNQRSGYNNQRPNGGQRGGYRQHTPDYDPNAKYSQKKRIEYKEYLEDPNAPIRLNKYLANAGVCSRREADEFIQAGVVRVNGEVVTELGTKVQRTDIVHFHDQLVNMEKKVYVLLNKPKDYITTSDDPKARKTVMELISNCCRERIYPVGRLDRNTTGVLLFTNDGELASKLTHPKFLKKKIYHVFLDKNVAASDLQQIADGITLEDGEVHADAISYASDTDKKQVGIEIHSGKNRIVRRIFESLGYRVTKLDRVMFAGLTKKGLKRGDWRFLSEKEVAMLHMGSFE